MSTNATSPPNVVQIPLPPGFTPEQWFELQGSIVAVAISIASAAAAAWWDYFNLLPHELALYRRRTKSNWRRSLGVYSFIILRYAGALAFIPALFISALQCSRCMLAGAMGQVFSILVTMSAGLIFALRVFSLWNGNKIVYAVVGIMYFLMVGSWIAVAASLRATEGPKTPYGSNCLLDPIPDWAPLSYITSLVFDTMILGLTLVQLRGEMMSGIARQLHRDSIMYFVLVTATNLVVVIVQLLPVTGPKVIVAKQAILCFPTLVNTAMGSRVFLNLKLYHERKKAGLISDTLHMTSGSQSRTAAESGGYSSQKGVMVVESSYIHVDPKTDAKSVKSIPKSSYV